MSVRVMAERIEAEENCKALGLEVRIDTPCQSGDGKCGGTARLCPALGLEGLTDRPLLDHNQRESDGRR